MIPTGGGRSGSSAQRAPIDSTTYTTLYAYGAADRMKAVTYPGGEVVTTAYNPQGES